MARRAEENAEVLSQCCDNLQLAITYMMENSPEGQAVSRRSDQRVRKLVQHIRTALSKEKAGHLDDHANRFHRSAFVAIAFIITEGYQ
jgi:hypothetical protein